MPSFDGVSRPLRQASSSMFSKAQLMVGLKADNNNDVESQTGASQDGSAASSTNQNFVDEAANLLCPDLTFQQRVIGFAACFTFGYLITFMSFKFFIRLIEGNPAPFAVNYSAGNLLALGASFFLCGPKRQFRNMLDEKRRMASIAYLSCLGATLVVVFIPLPWAIKLALLICLLLTQCAANMWYSLSYIPYGRKTALNIIKRTVGWNDSSPIEGFVGVSSSDGAN